MEDALFLEPVIKVIVDELLSSISDEFLTGAVLLVGLNREEGFECWTSVALAVEKVAPGVVRVTVDNIEDIDQAQI